MEYLFDVIRRMTGDSRQIYFNTGFPQYKIAQLKSKLFLVANSQSEKVCDWWYRLYHGVYSQADLKALEQAIEGKEYWMDTLEEIWTTDLDGGADLEY